ncbi:MAG: RNA-guided pseudouridylation complex pseudouridine synthase subunit Cbf5 [Methanobacteriota archaeon]|nr:MAG: RNA-guided pseudouridylation complex pseudouridine synthase subunit Cbf5 [Euryarchaeota archaeon]|tara:strand:- start:194 stop:1108 length:915 start_codon:yes stop_codon:yes gene_type:complete
MININADSEPNDMNGYSRNFQSRMNAGFILLDKHPGPTSHQLSAWARNLLGLEKLAHGGTLDPFASGVLPLLLGKSMKLTPLILKHEKTYIASLKLSSNVDIEKIKISINQLRGKIYNVPPEISAVKIQVRARNIKKLEILDFQDDNLLLEIECEAGTYVRTFARDLGLLIDQKITLKELRRTKSGSFTENKCITMAQLSDAIWKLKELGDDKAMLKILIPIEELVKDYPRIIIKESAHESLKNGAMIMHPAVTHISSKFRKGEKIAIQSLNGELLAIAEAKLDSTTISIKDRGAVAQPKHVFI